MLRWLIADVPRQSEITMQPGAEATGAVELRVKARDSKFDPMENASVQITVAGPPTDGKTNVVVLSGEASEKEPGVYKATYVPREPGAYLATGVILDSTGVKIGEVETGWASEPLAKEFASLQPNRSLLEEIARKTGGELITPGGLDDFVQGLNQKKAPIVETYSYPLWHKPAVFALALLCFISEWGIRRVKGLA
jgi:hypothetical protein